MSGYMVTTIVYGSKDFYMVNSDDPERACKEVLRVTDGKLAEALTVLSDETLAHYEVRPNEPWLCFTGDAQKTRVWGFGYGVNSTAFNDDSNIQDVGRGELRLL